MTVGIYAIINNVDGKCYVGKSVNVERRITHHRYYLRKPERPVKQTNRHLFNAVKKQGIDNFTFTVVEEFDKIDEDLISERELFWMLHFKSTERDHGYNLRADSSTRMIVHDDTRERISQNNRGVNNPNYGNKWDDRKKLYMSELKSEQHREGVYGDEWKSKISIKSSEFWSNNPDVKTQMANKVKIKKQKYNFIQMDECLNVVKVWPSVESIVNENPGWKWQNIYSVCNGHKKRIYGYKWKKVLKDG